MPYKDPKKDGDRKASWYRKHRASALQRSATWYLEHRDHCIRRETERSRTPEVKAKRAIYRANHPERFGTAAINAWRKANPERARNAARIYVNRRLARLANAPGKFDHEAWMQKVAFHGWRCLYCKKVLSLETLTMDHRKPLSKGGTNWLANLGPACKSCNSRKHAKELKWTTL